MCTEVEKAELSLMDPYDQLYRSIEVGRKSRRIKPGQADHRTIIHCGWKSREIRGQVGWAVEKPEDGTAPPTAAGMALLEVFFSLRISFVAHTAKFFTR